jgi:hypothetical protein
MIELNEKKMEERIISQLDDFGEMYAGGWFYM